MAFTKPEVSLVHECSLPLTLLQLMGWITCHEYW